MAKKEDILRILKYGQDFQQPLKNCLECGENLVYKWLPHKGVDEMKGEVEGKPANFWTQIWGGICRKCEKEEKPDFYPRVIFKDEKIKDISLKLEKEYQPERKLIEKIASTLLPDQKIKIRFTENYGVGVMDYGLVNFYQDPNIGWEVLNVCFPIELLNDREKTNPGILCEALAWELAFASAEVFKNPHRSKNSLTNCDCKLQLLYPQPQVVTLEHKGNGYDKVWHDKLDKFRERIKNEKLTAGSGYTALGKEFIFRDNLPYSVSNEEGEIIAITEISWLDKDEKKPKRNDFFSGYSRQNEPSQNSHQDSEQKNGGQREKDNFPVLGWWLLGGGMVTLVAFVIFIFKRRKKKVK